jgi:hypothetical protein
MKAPDIQSGRSEKVAAGWFNGCNSGKNAWLLPDTQYQWGVNVVCRGGIVQTRPGMKLKLTLPAGNLQGMCYFSANKDEDTAGDYLVFAVDGKVYYAPLPLAQPDNWETYRLKGLQFDPYVKQVYFCSAEKGKEDSVADTILVVPTYRILMIQDGVTACGFWDGTIEGHLDEQPDTYGTPIGTWMAWSGSRLWVARGSAVLASDLLDPTTFTERTKTTTEGGGDYRFNGDITGMGVCLGENRLTNLLVFTKSSTNGLLSAITERTEWPKTNNFQFILYPTLGCIAGKSIVNHAGLIWWYSQKGLVANDSVTSSFISSQIKYKDIEMAYSKRNMAPDISGICAASFESYLMMSVPSGDTLNAHTWVMDYAVADELGSTSDPCWQGIWAGFRPVEWAKAFVSEEEKLYCASIDYQAVPNSLSYNHIWEAFQADRQDTVTYKNDEGVTVTEGNPIYCSFITKYLGDGLDLKRFRFAEFNAVEMGNGDINLRVSFAGMHGPFSEIFRAKLNATQIPPSNAPETLVQLYRDEGGPFRLQSRYLRSREPQFPSESGEVPNTESPYSYEIDSRFALYFQWCGRMGIDSCRFYVEPYEETVFAQCYPDENQARVLTQDGTSAFFDL